MRVKDISFSMGKEKIGIVGESGSGKTVTGRAILKLLPASARISADAMDFNGQDILHKSEKEMRGIRGRGIAMVMQDPRYSLNPVRTVGRQIAESYLAHRNVSKKEARRRALEMLEAVRIRNPGTGLRAISPRSLGRHGPADHDRHDADPGARPSHCG